MFYMLNGNVSHEQCPVCGEDAEVYHGLSEKGTGVHEWHCPKCGESVAFVGYDCELCNAPQVRNGE
jgi:ribosomal protein L37AE/L43A